MEAIPETQAERRESSFRRGTDLTRSANFFDDLKASGVPAGLPAVVRLPQTLACFPDRSPVPDAEPNGA